MRKKPVLYTTHLGVGKYTAVKAIARCSKCACWDRDPARLIEVPGSGCLMDIDSTSGECRRFPKIENKDQDDHCWEFRPCVSED